LRPSARSLARAAGWLVAAVALALAVRAVAAQWGEVRSVAASLRPRWGLVVLSSVYVLAAYAVLIESWRRLLAGWSVRLSFFEASTLWLVSSLARYLPGAGLQLGALGVLARQRGVSGVAAASAALLNTLLNVLTGVALVVLLGGRSILAASGREPSPTILGLAIAATAAAVLALPAGLPRLARLVARLTGRTVDLDRVSFPLVLGAAAANAGAWLLYGVAFRTLSAALFGPPTGAVTAYVAVYTASYLWGLFAFAVPAGLGAQEFALSLLMPPLVALPLAQTAVLTVAARLWRTVIETAPAALLLVAARVRERPPPPPTHGSI
jgi:uncharacterized membrane protein YbhN (UPF0104 family)